MSEPVNCPACGIGLWKAKARGIRTCPHCAATLRLTRHGIAVKTVAQRHTFKRAGGRNYASMAKARVYTVPDRSGKVACANCAKPTAFLDSIDGRLDGDGLMKIEIEREVSGVVLTETLTIPQNVRGRFCPACVRKYPVRPIGRMAVAPTSRFTLDYPMTAELTPFKPRSGRKADAQETWKYKVEKDKDPNPEWAHTFDATWLACSTPGKVFGADDTGDASDKFRLEQVGRHPIACGCPRCRRYRRETDYTHVELPPRNTVKAVRLAIDMRAARLPRVRWTSDVPHVPQSANRIVGRGGRGARVRTHPADGIIAAIRAAIQAGMADSAATYARLLTRQAYTFPRIGPLAAR